jgi:catechol 2,3-dioxygenase-like lactoylglutathione lyase family enzyme
MRVLSLDHLVLTVRDLDATIAFYEELGMQHTVVGEDRHALSFGEQKINLHVAGRRRTGASGPIRSIYVRDPDGNLVELSTRL